MVTVPGDGPASTFFIVSTYLGLNDRDNAFAWLQRAYEERDSGMTLLSADPHWDSLRSDPRFQDLLRRVGPVT